MNAVTDAQSVDQTVFCQILNAYRSRYPGALILDDEYHECLKQLVSNEQEQNEGHVQQRSTTSPKISGLQDRLGTKLFLKNKDEQPILVAGTKTRHLELVPFSRVYTALQELTALHKDQTELQQVVKEKVLGIPEEIVQEYCDMASAATLLDEQPEDKGTIQQLRKCAHCQLEKTFDEFLSDEKEPSGFRVRCRDCDSRARHKRKVKVYPGEELIEEDQKSKESQGGFSGTAICAACGRRKLAKEYDKDRSKPLALKCKECAKEGAPLRSKSCCSCHRDLTLDHFYRDSYTKAGFRPRCMECMRARKGLPRPSERRHYTKSTHPRPLHPPNQDDGMQLNNLQEGGIEDGPKISNGRVPQKKRTRTRRRGPQVRMKVILNGGVGGSNKPQSPKLDELKEETVVVPVSRHERGRHGTRPRSMNFETPSAKVGALSVISTSMRGTSEKSKGENEDGEQKLQNDCNGIGSDEDGEKPKAFSGSTIKDKQGSVTKYCTGCHAFKSTEEFGRDCSKVSGLRSRCRYCQRRRNRPNSPSLLSNTELSNDMPIARRKIPRKPNRKRRPVQKVCLKCDLEKPTTDFIRDRIQVDNFSAFCKRCTNAEKKRQEKRQQQLHPSSDKTSLATQKHYQNYGPRVEEENMEHILDYIDALLPESSGESAGSGDFDADEETEKESTPNCRSHRICMGCGVDKCWIEFLLNPMLPAGLCPLCKDCMRGNGVGGRRAMKQRPQKRRCVRCKAPRSSIHFAKSLLFPNRVTLVCDKCRYHEQNNIQCGENGTSQLNNSEGRWMKRQRMETNGLRTTLDVMDYECDALRARDPGGGEQLWKRPCSESDSSFGPWTKKRKKIQEANFNRRKGLMNTELKLERNGVTVTHHVPAEDWMTSDQLFNTENSFWKSDEKKRRKPMVLEKQCKLCGSIKTMDCFTADNMKPCRLNSQCIDCCSRAL